MTNVNVNESVKNKRKLYIPAKRERVVEKKLHLLIKRVYIEESKKRKKKGWHTLYGPAQMEVTSLSYIFASKSLLVLIS